MPSRTLRTAAASASIVFCLLAAAQDKETIGVKPAGRSVVPVNQVVTPYGLTTTLPGMRPQALAVSPDGRIVAVSGKTPALVILDTVTLKVLQEVALPAE